MVDRRVIIFQIEDMLSKINKEKLLKFGGHIDNGSAFLELMTNVLTLLKEQEPVTPERAYSGGGSTWWNVCGACKTAINPNDKYCHECGKALSWK